MHGRIRDLLLMHIKSYTFVSLLRFNIPTQTMLTNQNAFLTTNCQGRLNFAREIEEGIKLRLICLHITLNKEAAMISWL